MYVQKLSCTSNIFHFFVLTITTASVFSPAIVLIGSRWVLGILVLEIAPIVRGLFVPVSFQVCQKWFEFCNIINRLYFQTFGTTPPRRQRIKRYEKGLISWLTVIFRPYWGFLLDAVLCYLQTSFLLALPPPPWQMVCTLKQTNLLTRSFLKEKGIPRRFSIGWGR